MLIKLCKLGLLTLATSCMFASMPGLGSASADSTSAKLLAEVRNFSKDQVRSNTRGAAEETNVQLKLVNQTNQPVIVAVHQDLSDPEKFTRLQVQDNKILLAPGMLYNIYVFAGSWNSKGTLEPKFQWGPNDIVADPDSVIEWVLKPEKALEFAP